MASHAIFLGETRIHFVKKKGVWLNISCADRELMSVYINGSLASIYIAYTGQVIICIMLSVFSAFRFYLCYSFVERQLGHMWEFPTGIIFLQQILHE
jgi:hypothetical protein